MCEQKYFEFLMRLSIWGYPPWLTIKTTDCDMAENSIITVFTKDFLNYWSALMFLSSSST